MLSDCSKRSNLAQSEPVRCVGLNEGRLSNGDNLHKSANTLQVIVVQELLVHGHEVELVKHRIRL